jgi:zinc protease
MGNFGQNFSLWRVLFALSAAHLFTQKGKYDAAVAVQNSPLVVGAVEVATQPAPAAALVARTETDAGAIYCSSAAPAPPGVEQPGAFTMPRSTRFVLLGALLSCALVAQALAQSLPADPSFLTGELENGLKYVVRQHANPPGRAAMWMHIHSGSLNETDRQRGLAHYLEHMAFNGSDNFPPGSVVPFFQSLGMTFGRDQNAFTNMEQTTYQLSLPDAKVATLGKGMTFFADVLWRLALTPREIDAERQIILEERRRGLSGRQRTSDYVLERIAPGSLYGQRDTIGKEETIKAVNEADFRDYYSKWYCASNATLIVVADTDPNEVIKVIKDTFGAAPKRPRPVPQPPGVQRYERSFAIVASDPEINSETVRITRLEPARPPTTTYRQFRDDLVLRLGTSALNRRFDEKVAKGGTSYLSANASAGNDANTLYSIELIGRAAPGKWQAALEEMAMELQRARAFGFSDHELDEVKRQWIAGAERAVETEATAPASMFMARVNSAITSGDTLLSPTQRLEMLTQFLPSITAEHVAKRFADEFNPTAVAFIAVLPSGPNVPTEAQLLEIGVKALSVTPPQEAQVAHAHELLKELPHAGSVSEMQEHAASGVWSAWLSNNVRLHYRYMDYRKNDVSVTITLVGGELLEDASNRGITQAARLAWTRPATQSLTSTDIRDIMAGKKVSVRGGGGFGGGRGGRGGGFGGLASTGSISLTISGSPNPTDLEPGFQLAYLLLTQPRIESASFTQFQTTTKQMLEEMMKTPMTYGGRLVMSAPFPDDEVRTQMLTPAQVDNLTIDAAQLWLEKLIQESPIEVAIVGDISRENAIDLARKYLGALPPRQRISPETHLSLRSLKRPSTPRNFDKTIDTETKQAFVYSGFYGADAVNVNDVRALSMAAQILSTRMVKEVREEAQLVYSIGAGSRPATTYPGFGTFAASAPTEPSKVDALLAKLASMYEDFANNGPTEAEVDVAKKQVANTLDEQMKEPGFWSGRLNSLTYEATKLDDIVNAPAAFQALTPRQIKDTFAKYYSKDKAIKVVVRPAATAQEGK